jgi:hypothetical protein
VKWHDGPVDLLRLEHAHVYAECVRPCPPTLSLHQGSYVDAHEVGVACETEAK